MGDQDRTKDCGSVYEELEESWLQRTKLPPRSLSRTRFYGNLEVIEHSEIPRAGCRTPADRLIHIFSPKVRSRASA
jgi:hypothetical protein